jgi:peptide/nickel transport system ATP-binding protein
MVYQEPGRALNPSIRVGRQVAEVFEIAGLDRQQALERAEEMLRKVQISDPAGSCSATRTSSPAGCCSGR